MSKKAAISHFGSIIRELRLANGLSLRKVAATLNADQGVLSKIERGLRHPQREHVKKLAKLFKTDESSLLISFMADSMLREVSGEKKSNVKRAIREANVASGKRGSVDAIDTASLKKGTTEVLAAHAEVSKAWRNNAADGALRIVLELNKSEEYSLFNLLALNVALEEALDTKVQVTETGYLTQFAAIEFEEHKELIYER